MSNIDIKKIDVVYFNDKYNIIYIKYIILKNLYIYFENKF
jgi:hypothetical protein